RAAGAQTRNVVAPLSSGTAPRRGHAVVPRSMAPTTVPRRPGCKRQGCGVVGAEPFHLGVRHRGRPGGYARAPMVLPRSSGVLPIYVAPDGADHVGWPELFQEGAVAGVPPDDWSATGQLWGNPLYDWETQRRTCFRWWVERFRRTFELVDATRIDHFRGFVAYWAIPERHKTARHGRWRRGPGAEPFRAAEAELGELQLIAEDLGHITPPVLRLRDELGL